MNAQNNKVTEYNNGDNNNSSNNNNGNPKLNNNPARKINLPNKLTIFRIILVPVFMIFILIPENEILPPTWCKIFAAAFVLIASLTDLIDGIIARKMHLITDFGKFLDPVADKFMIIGAMIAITAADSFSDMRFITVWVTTIIFLREFSVTSVRLVANSSDGNVIAAGVTGKIKTFSQIVCIMTILLEEAVLSQNLNTPPYLFSYITIAVMVIMTVYSGFVYFKNYWNYIDPAK